MNESRSALDVRTKKSVEDDLKGEPIEKILIRTSSPGSLKGTLGTPRLDG